MFKHMPKIFADCMCANLLPVEKDDCPSFWIANENWIQMVQLDPTKASKVIALKSQKYEFE